MAGGQRGTPRDYAYLDRFGRVLRSRWEGGTELCDATLTYDRNSNVATAVDGVFVSAASKRLHDALYTIDSLNRLTNTLEGHLSGGAISGSDDTRVEKWTGLTQTGNWERYKLDLNADGDFTDTGERDDTGTFNKVNEWLTRDLPGAIRPRPCSGSTMPRL